MSLREKYASTPPDHLYPDPAGAMLILAAATMRPMDDLDRQGFQGCETENPLIGEVTVDEITYVVVLDGDVLLLLLDFDRFGGEQYRLERY